MPVGEFVRVEKETGTHVDLTAIPMGTFTNSCDHCTFQAEDDCTVVRCYNILWATRDTYHEYLQQKLLK